MTKHTHHLLVATLGIATGAALAIARADNATVLAAAPAIDLDVPTGVPTKLCAALLPVAAAKPQRFQRTFFDDFDALDLAWGRWTPHYDGGYDWMVKRTLVANKEQQLYVDPGYQGTATKPLSLNPFVLKDGKLDIVADRAPPALRPSLYGYEFTSGLLTSRKSLVQQYGFFEMRARIPAGRALWPAFWLLAEDRSWPPEIDVLEVVGQKPDQMVQTTHWKDPVTGLHQVSGCRTTLITASTGYHQYGVMWDATRITYYIDRVPVTEIATPPGLDKKMYMLLNLAVGGVMVGVADARTPVPAVFSIDWVAAYEKTQ
jgi:beta-glucanase (GH16 family)